MIKKFIKINIFCINLLILTTNSLFSQTDSIINIKEVVINAQRIPLLYSDISRIRIINSHDIQNNSSHSVNDLLKSMANIDIRQRGIDETQADISIKGGSFEQTLILLNGFKINDPQTGHHNMNIPVDIENIDRIEVLEGSGSRVFGTNAFSGALNIITNDTKTNNIKASITTGSFDYLKATASFNITKSDICHNLSVSKKSSSGYITDTDFDILNVFYHPGYHFKKGKVEAQLSYEKKAFGANNFYTPKYQNQFESTKMYFTGIRMEYGNLIKFIPSIYWRRHFDKYELFREDGNWYKPVGKYYIKGDDTAKYVKNVFNASNYYTGHNYHRTDILGCDLHYQILSGFGKTAFGAEYRKESIISSKLGNKSDSIKVPNENAWYIYSKNRENYNFYVEHMLSYNKIQISCGGFINYNTDFKWNHNLGLDLNYNIIKNIKLYISVNQSLRIPTFTELFYKDAYTIGNINLKPEKSVTYDFGINYFNKFVSIKSSVFERLGTNMIDWVRLTTTDQWKCDNITEINTAGFDISVNINFHEIYGEKFILNSVKACYAYIDIQKQSKQYISKYVLDYLKNKVTLDLNHKFIFKTNISWYLIYQDREGTFTSYNQGIVGNEVNYKPFYLLNSKISKNYKMFQFFICVNNILNEKYYDFGNILMPNTFINFGIKLNYNFNNM